jgi:hypothetical protein
MNMFIFRAAIYRMFAAEPDLTVDTAVQTIRREYRNELKGISNGKLQPVVEEIAQQVKGAESSPVARAYLKLLFDECELRGDLQEALKGVEPTSPAHTRLLVDLIGRLGQRESNGTEQQPAAELHDAIAAVTDVAAGDMFRDRLAALYQVPPP